MPLTKKQLKALEYGVRHLKSASENLGDVDTVFTEGLKAKCDKLYQEAKDHYKDQHKKL